MRPHVTVTTSFWTVASDWNGVALPSTQVAWLPSRVGKPSDKSAGGLDSDANKNMLSVAPVVHGGSVATPFV